ncbi:hypothetical protein BCR34DRAFT_594341 [Clohesyomyces aquaticus]|uniref:SET domain-containing protein n=1 Tax=Clohesyomyces aquaticus TaxID=1231657 RepID=A0A1Y1Y9S7_9PLEO|nr:hypothetical protein BCR34DRAFT_594341 [Clohesyomyces aquaticus]
MPRKGGAQVARRGVPKDWPQGVVYLPSPLYSKRLSPDTIKTLIFPKSDLPTREGALTTRGPYSNVKITPITDPTHPANGQYGLVACQHLLPDSFILPYIGYVHDKADTDEQSDYDLSLDRDLSLGVDASKMGNEARFINDYRGVSTGPNAEFRDTFVDLGNGNVEKRVGVFVMCAGKSGKKAKGILQGQEILVSYGKGFWTERLKVQE